MFRCERCGSSYSETRGVGLENCPCCRLRDQVAAPLTFKLFKAVPGGGDEAPERVSPPARSESAERRVS
jgi:hypothetical protein